MKLEIPKLSLPQLDALKGQLVTILTAPEHRRALVAGAAIVLGLGFWYFGIIQPTATRVATFKARYESAQREIRRLGSPSDVEQVKARVTALEARVRAAFERMSQGAQLVQILKQLSADATRYRIDVETIDVRSGEAGAPPGSPAQPSQEAGRGLEPGKGAEPEKKAKPVEIRTEKLELTLSSSYEATARFLDGLKALPAFVVIDGLKVERDAKIFPNLRVLLTLKVHSIKKLPEGLTQL